MQEISAVITNIITSSGRPITSQQLVMNYRLYQLQYNGFMLPAKKKLPTLLVTVSGEWAFFMNTAVY
jgi:hypothetical protein